MTKEEIGAILKNLRLQAGKTQKEVAELLGRSQQVVGHWETGYAQPDANTLFLLCGIYDADINEAFGYGKKPSAPVAEDDRAFVQKALETLPAEGYREVADFLRYLLFKYGC